MRGPCLLALLCATSGATSVATPSRALAAPAPELVEEASRLYSAGRFDEALAGFSAAWELEPRPQLLFHIGQCHRRLGQHEEAVFFFRGYLQRSPRAADRAQVEELIAEERDAIAAAPAVHEEWQRSPGRARWYRKGWVWAVAGSVVGVAAAGVAVGVALGRPAAPSGGLGTIDARR